jgi:hypothetical protein
MAIKKSWLYSSLWKSCDELRGGMDASQYKDIDVADSNNADKLGSGKEMVDRLTSHIVSHALRENHLD